MINNSMVSILLQYDNTVLIYVIPARGIHFAFKLFEILHICEV